MEIENLFVTIFIKDTISRWLYFAKGLATEILFDLAPALRNGVVIRCSKILFKPNKGQKDRSG